MSRFVWDSCRFGLIAAGIYGAAIEPVIVGSWWNARIAAGLLLGVVTLSGMRGRVNFGGALALAFGLLGLITVATGSQSLRPLLAVVAVGVLMSSGRLLVPTLRRVRIHLEEERA